jgi:metalloprotein, YbeY/UPF0054 family
MAIIYQAEEIKFPDIKRRPITSWIKAVAKEHDRLVGDISYVFCSDDKILEVNKQYLNHDYYTDIITFDYSEDNIISGDLFISLDTVRTNSEKFNTDYSEELLRVIIHGVLHLCGYKDKTKEEEKRMRELEEEAIRIYDFGF